MIVSLIVSLILTLFIELSISMLLGIKSNNDIKVVICANLCTNPVVVYIANYLKIISYGWKYYNIVILLLEIVAILVEFKLFNRYLKDYKKSALWLSIINNVLSFTIGIIINNILL